MPVGAALAGQSEGQAPHRELVLVSGPVGPARRLTTTELRRVFLGMPVEIDGVRLRPLLNTSDPLIPRIFLQKIMFMSANHYHRRLRALAFRSGRPRPREVRNVQRLVEILVSQPGTVALMWKREVPTGKVRAPAREGPLGDKVRAPAREGPLGGGPLRVIQTIWESGP